jgi:hypothetical protein
VRERESERERERERDFVRLFNHIVMLVFGIGVYECVGVRRRRRNGWFCMQGYGSESGSDYVVAMQSVTNLTQHVAMQSVTNPSEHVARV